MIVVQVKLIALGPLCEQCDTLSHGRVGYHSK